MTSRIAVYMAIDTERTYQDNLGSDRTEFPTSGTRSIDHEVGEFVTMLQHYQNQRPWPSSQSEPYPRTLGGTASCNAWGLDSCCVDRSRRQ